MEDYKTLYEQRLERAKEENKKCGDNKGRIRMIENIFPELKESDDERIRKAILELVKQSSHILNPMNQKSMLAWLEMQNHDGKKWIYEDVYLKEKEQVFQDGVTEVLENPQRYGLEKQGEQTTDKVEPKFKVGDTIRHKGSLAEYTIESISGGCYHGKGWGLSIDCDGDYELVEQKPLGKVAPKFKIGDTIVEKDPDEYDYETIKDIKDERYIFTDGYCMNIDEQEGWQLVKTPTIIKQKPAWSEEDEEMYNQICNDIDYLSRFTDRCDINLFNQKINWLKSLKERMKGE